MTLKMQKKSANGQCPRTDLFEETTAFPTNTQNAAFD